MTKTAYILESPLKESYKQYEISEIRANLILWHYKYNISIVLARSMTIGLLAGRV